MTLKEISVSNLIFYSDIIMDVIFFKYHRNHRSYVIRHKSYIIDFIFIDKLT